MKTLLFVKPQLFQIPLQINKLKFSLKMLDLEKLRNPSVKLLIKKIFVNLPLLNQLPLINTLSVQDLLYQILKLFGA